MLRNAAYTAEYGALSTCVNLPAAAPEKGEDFAKIEEDYQKFILPGLTHWQHPSFFAYYPTGCTFEGILGELYANFSVNPGFNVRLQIMIIFS